MKIERNDLSATPEEREGKSTRKTSFREKLSPYFEKYDLRDRNRVVKLGKSVLFGLVLFFELVLLLQFFGTWQTAQGWLRFVLFLIALIGLGVVEGIKLFFAKTAVGKGVCYALDFICVFTLVGIVGNNYLVVLYLILITELHFSIEKVFRALGAFLAVLLSYVLTYWLANLFYLGAELTTTQILAQSFSALVALVLHFFVIRFAISFYRQYLRLDKTLKELDASKSELEKAYAELEEATVLAERQRIAKDIHDTAGHSLTTVIMQTEAAKLIIEENPAEAKAKIVAANLQAKHTLEELRESVHLLSGVSEKEPLKSALLRTISESTSGTEIVIRSEIEEIEVSDEQYRLVYNTLKEGISNGLRHGRATAFWFELKAEDGELRFLLSDNGTGVDLASLKEGFGLSGLKREVARLGGNATFLSEKEEGFEIQLRLPLNGQKPQKEQE